MTERLYFHDAYLQSFDAQVLSTSEDGLRVVLDRTAFYPTSGGQPNDLGTLNGVPVVDVVDRDGEIEHVLASPLSAKTAQGQIDWPRRLDHMAQHTGQHLLSAVLQEDFGLSTVSFHLGLEDSTVDVEPNSATEATLQTIEARANEVLRRNLTTSLSFEDSSTAQGLRKASDRAGLLRIVTIEGLDRSACGGTHVLSTGEIGSILLGKTEKIRKSLRIAFYCGSRALLHSRRQLAALSQETHQLRTRLAEAEKSAQRLSQELSSLRGAQRAASGSLTWIEEVAELTDELRNEANTFLDAPDAFVLLHAPTSGAVLLGAHPSRGLDCGKTLKQLVAERGGRGGGTPRLAQGSVVAAEVEALKKFGLSC